jgi:mRNA interferase MazF
LVAPVTGWQDRFAQYLWFVRLEPRPENGLTKTSAVDTLQLRGVAIERFRQRIGHLPASVMEEITTAIVAVIQHK